MSQSARNNLHEGSTVLEHNCDLDIKNPAQHRRLVSIIVTISTASRTFDHIYKMIKMGVNIFRLNFSYESHEAHAATIELVRDALERLYKEEGYQRAVALALDTRGPQIRTGLLEDAVEITLRKGDILRLSINRDVYDKGTKEILYIDYPNIINLTKPGDLVFIDDGILRLTIMEVGVDGIICEVLQGGVIGSNCNVILPEVDIDLPAVSEKDMYDLQFGVQTNVDFVFASAVRNANSIKELRTVLGERGKHIKIIAKIDSKISLTRVTEIMKAADGLLIARADIGTQIPTEKLFITQKALLAQCNRLGKPVIVASHILESMRKLPMPTRAEIFDLSNIIIDGADSVLLSAEVAIGPYPIETVQMCDLVCREAEKVLWFRDLFSDLTANRISEVDAAHSLAIAAIETAKRSHSTLIVVITTSGRSAALVGKYRPRCPIMAVTRCHRAARFVHLHRGIIPVLYHEKAEEEWMTDNDARVTYALTLAKKMELISDGDPIVIVSSWKDGGGFVNNLRVIYAFFEIDRVSCLFKAERRSKSKLSVMKPEARRSQQSTHVRLDRDLPENDFH